MTKLLDREAKPNGYSLTVVARDHGYPTSRYSTARVNVTISDINDNAPKFDKFTYSGMVREDAFLSDVVTNVKASDKDEGLSGAIIYSITGKLAEGVNIRSVILLYCYCYTVVTEVRTLEQPNHFY